MPRPQRSAGRAAIALDQGRLTRLQQSGSAKVMLPRCHGNDPELVFLNTSGGLTSGDRLDYNIALGPGQRAIATTQTAERAYRADGPPATAHVSLSLDVGADLCWLPQETILFDRAALCRETRVDLADDACFLGLETIVLGRAAMGERLTQVQLTDRRDIRRAGRRLLLDPFRLDGASITRAAGPALLGGLRAMAVLILAAPGAADTLPRLRAELTEPDVTAAASAREDVLIVRALAPDAWPLRRQMIRLIACLRPGALPRVWQS